MGYPFFGHGYKNGDEPESIFVLDETERFKSKFKNYMKKIEFGENINKFYSYLDQYTSKHICIFNKFKDQIFIMYFGLKVEEFLWFLIKF